MPGRGQTPPDTRTLSYAEACRELRRTRRLYESGAIGIRAWCDSVRRIIAACERGRAVL